MAATVLVATGLVAGATVPAAAHSGGSPDVRVLLDEVPAALDGMTVAVAMRAAPQLVLANPTGDAVEVLGGDGRPFLRIGPGGVEANLAVAEWYTTNDPFGGTPLPDGVGGADDWRTIATEPSWGWYDHRLHPGPLLPPPEVAARGVTADLDSWAVPVRVGGVEVLLRGRIVYDPVRGTYVARLREDAPLGPDTTVTVLPGTVPGLFVDHRGDRPLSVLGRDGEPFLRFQPAGGVEANLLSPAWVDSARADAGTPPDRVDASAPPRWAVVSTAPRLGWLELRADPAAYAPATPAAADPALEWSVPVVLGDVPDAIDGVTEWVPRSEGDAPVGAAAWPWRGLAVVAVAVLAAAALAWPWWRRRAPRH